MSVIVKNLYSSFWIRIIIFFIIMALLTACGNLEKPIPSKMVKILSHNTMAFKEYEIPRSIFRGVLWPSEENGNFQIWTIKGQKENYYNISAPNDFAINTEVTDQWDVGGVKDTGKTKIFRITKKDKSKSIELEVPIKKRNYNFAVLENEAKENLILFMDISESIMDKGLFGYILIH